MQTQDDGTSLARTAAALARAGCTTRKQQKPSQNKTYFDKISSPTPFHWFVIPQLALPCLILPCPWSMILYASHRIGPTSTSHDTPLMFSLPRYVDSCSCGKTEALKPVLSSTPSLLICPLSLHHISHPPLLHPATMRPRDTSVSLHSTSLTRPVCSRACQQVLIARLRYEVYATSAQNEPHATRQKRHILSCHPHRQKIYSR